MTANSFSVSTNPLILFKESTQLLNEPWPGKTILSLELIFLRSEVTSRLTLAGYLCKRIYDRAYIARLVVNNCDIHQI